MKVAVLAISILALASCSKNKCYTCTITRVSPDKAINERTVYPDHYCGKKKKEIDDLVASNTYITSRAHPTTGAPVDVQVSMTCKESGK